MKSLLRIRAVMFKEVRQLLRDKLTFGMIVMVPLIQLMLFGYAINTNIRNIPVGLVDLSQTQTSRLLVEKAQMTQLIKIAHHYRNPENARLAIQAGEIRAALVIPDDVNQRLAQQRPLAQWMVDGTDNIIGATILGLVDMPFSLFEEESNTQVKSDNQTFSVTLFYNPSRRSEVNIVPGLVGIILTMTMILFTSISIVRERERGNLELLITTPVSSIELMIAKIIPYIFAGLIQVSIILGLGLWLFNVPINGSYEQTFLACLLFISASLTLGLVISTLAQTQMQAMQMTVFILLPSILLSGFMFPYEGMPQYAQWLAEVLPVTHFMRLIRGVVIREANLFELWPDTLWLAIFTCVGLLVAAKRFRKTLD